MDVFSVQQFYADRTGSTEAWWLALDCDSSGDDATSERDAGAAECEGASLHEGYERDALRFFTAGRGDGAARGCGQWEAVGRFVTTGDG